MKRFTDLRAWQACVTYKRAIYRLCEKESLVNDWKRRGQLEDSVAGPPGHLAEGFGRFSPLDFARFAVMARASLLESQNHLLDLWDRGHISQEQQASLNGLADTAIQEVTGLIEYLQSPQAARNAQQARQRGVARHAARKSRSLSREPSTSAEPERRTPNPEPQTSEPQTSEPRTPNPNAEVRTRKGNGR